MKLEILLEKLKPETIVFIRSKKFKILEHIVWWQAKANENYDKYILQDEEGKKDYRLFISGDFLGFSTIFHYEFEEPMPKVLVYKGRKYNLVQDEFCVVKKTEGERVYKVGDAEIWWDYESASDEGKGLSLGRNWNTWEREDLEVEEINRKDVSIK